MNPPVRTSGTAIASLVFGIITWVGLPFIGALVAVICGHVARGEIRRMPPGEIDGDGLAIAGMILGYAQLALFLLGLLLFVGILIFGFSLSGMH
ncbi:DUF4190 domain-containing protein [Dokdonella immobilis]|uniref:DUF4190 domain-containing protein n=1 Tax=Dokdonella immobilis TaxID=578942 RepID=A0A1I4XZB5_9GAMM|nr:DUF4190 domain-containing protein [Dokdonella immobilis]SFN30743.1 protein of unknown function [Dokdonella immobilis]